MSISLNRFVILGLDVKLLSLHKRNAAQSCYDHNRLICFCEARNVNLPVIHLMGFLVLLATVQLWNLLCQISGLQVIGRAHSKAWAEVQGFLLVILMLPTGYDIAFNLLFGWSSSNYWTFFSSAVTVVGLLMGISHHKTQKKEAALVDMLLQKLSSLLGIQPRVHVSKHLYQQWPLTNEVFTRGTILILLPWLIITS